MQSVKANLAQLMTSFAVLTDRISSAKASLDTLNGKIKEAGFDSIEELTSFVNENADSIEAKTKNLEVKINTALQQISTVI